jgi:hypothetical protein
MCFAMVLAALLTAPQLPALEVRSAEQQERKVPEQPPAPVTGDVAGVDPKAKTVTIKTSAGEQGEMKFSYSDATEIVGGGPDLAGLAGEGASITVHYDVHGTANVATRIVIHPKK